MKYSGLIKTFLNELLQSEELRITEFIDCFLLISDYGQFTDARKSAEQNLPKRDFKYTMARRSFENSLDALDLEKLETKKQELHIKISPFLKKFFEAYNLVADQKKMLMGSLRDLSRELIGTLAETERNFSDMGKVSAKLHQISSEFNQSHKNSEDSVFEKTFFALQNNFICLAEVYRRDSKAARDNFFTLFNEWEKDLGALDDIVKVRNWSHDEYFSFKNDLKERKLRVLNSPPGKEKLEFDQISMKYACISKENEDFPRIRTKFMMSEVGIG